MTETDEHSAAQPSVCPVCSTEQDFDDCITHDSRQNGNLEFLWECTSCDFRFTTIKQLENSGPEVHTLLWQETEDGKVTQVIHVPEGKGHFSVKVHRADLNMRATPNYEVQGREWAIERLYELFSQSYDLEEQPKEDYSIAWLPDEMQSNDS